jgi:hypothetical protein
VGFDSPLLRRSRVVGSIVSIDNAHRELLDECVKSERIPDLHQAMMGDVNPCVFVIKRGQGKNRGLLGNKETEGRTINQLIELRGIPPSNY